MKPAVQLRLAGFVVCLYCAWEARDVMAAWLHSPFDKLGAVAFLVWALPLVVLYRASSPPPTWLFVALGITLLGVAMDLNVMKDAGFAVVCASIAGVATSRIVSRVVCLGTAASWLPALGWIFSGRGPVEVNCLRVAVAVAGTLVQIGAKR